MTLVLDASVIVKWLFDDSAREHDFEIARDLMRFIAEGGAAVVQPIHWLIEVAAVLTREAPLSAIATFERLLAMELPTDDHPLILQRAMRMSMTSSQHLFDTLYHAVAIEHGALLVTADDRYRRVTQRFGHIMSLRRWNRSLH